jgi:hypothetical protein
MGSRFSVSRPAEQPFALNAGWGASRLFSQALRLIGQALIQWRGLLYTASLLHGATPQGSTAGVLVTDGCHGRGDD